MKINIGDNERVIRGFAGMALTAILINYNSAWALIGIPIMISALIGMCPLYSLLGLKTVSKEDSAV